MNISFEIFHYISLIVFKMLKVSFTMGVDSWVDRGHFLILSEVDGTPCVLSSY